MPNGGERREMRARFENVVKANDRDVVRDAPPRFAEHLHCAEAGEIVTRQHGGEWRAR